MARRAPRSVRNARKVAASADRRAIPHDCAVCGAHTTTACYPGKAWDCCPACSRDAAAAATVQP